MSKYDTLIYVYIWLYTHNINEENICNTYAVRLSHVLSFEAPRTVADQVSLPMEFSRQEYWGTIIGVGYHFLLQGIFLTQGSNTYLLHLLHWPVDS